MFYGQTTTTTTPVVVPVDPARPLTDFLVDMFDLEAGSLTAGILGAVIEPLLQIILILLLAWLVLRLLRRLGRRVIVGLKDDVPKTSMRRAQRLDTLGSVTS